MPLERLAMETDTKFPTWKLILKKSMSCEKLAAQKYGEEREYIGMSCS